VVAVDVFMLVAVDVFMLVGVGFAHRTGAEWCQNGPVVLGALTGLLAASAFDGAVLAYDAPPKPRVGRGPARTHALYIRK
jgi:hypothetical protein